MPTILIIDDREAERRLLYHALKAEHRVLEAAHGARALGWLASTEVDLVILDMHLPPTPESAQEGIRIHRMLRAAYPDCPVVIATGDEDPELARRMKAAGVAGYLIKPVSPQGLRGVIARALRARAPRLSP